MEESQGGQQQLNNLKGHLCKPSNLTGELMFVPTSDPSCNGGNPDLSTSSRRHNIEYHLVPQLTRSTEQSQQETKTPVASSDILNRIQCLETQLQTFSEPQVSLKSHN